MGLNDLLYSIENQKRRPWRTCSLADLRNYYTIFYEGEGRSQVNEVDGGFYSTLLHMGLLEEVFPKTKTKVWRHMKIKDFRAYYKTHYNGMSRREVERIGDGFYQMLLIRGLVNKVLPKSRYKYWKNMGLNEFKEYYQEHYDGMSRREVRKKDPSFYRIVHKKGLLDEVLPKLKPINQKSYLKN